MVSHRLETETTFKYLGLKVSAKGDCVKAARVLILLVILIVSATSVAALPSWMVKLFDVCDDSDKGPKDPANPLPFVGIPGTTQSREDKFQDQCLSVQGEPVPVSDRIREFYCDENGKIQSRVYNCEDLGFTACAMTPQGARCVDEVPPTKCGDGVLQLLEECDPPGNACMTAAGKPGVCGVNCKCLVPPPKKCGNKRLEPGEQCDPPGANCVSPGGKASVCDAGCKCPEPQQKRCGDNKVQPPEQCDPPGKVCKDARGNIGVCTNQCNCEAQQPRCGDSRRDPGEECDPPGAKCVNAQGDDATCLQDCKCPVVRVRTWCSNNRVDQWEDCDPPGVRCVKGGKVGICNDYCKCAGEGGVLLPEPKEGVLVGPPTTPQTPPETPPPAPQKSCEELCAERGMSTKEADHSKFIMDYLSKYSCVSGARITMKGTLSITGAANCKCYSRDPPSINVDSTPPVCQTPCGPVTCGQSAQCPCPDRPNCVLTASCSWNGWKWQSGRPVPIIGAQSAAAGQ
jgi:hypothetical protein